MNIIEICARHHLPIGAVIGTPRCTPKALPARFEIVRLCRAEGMRYHRIAKILKCSKSTAHRYGKYKNPLTTTL